MLLVVGGQDGRNILTSTEIQVTRASAWKEVQPYPLAVRGLSGATINNVVYMTGQDYYHLATLHQDHCHCRRKGFCETVYQQYLPLQRRRWWVDKCRQPDEDRKSLACSVCCLKTENPYQLLMKSLSWNRISSQIDNLLSLPWRV